MKLVVGGPAFGSEPPYCAVYEVGASLLVGAADCSPGDSAACSAGGCSITGSADGPVCSSVGAGASVGNGLLGYDVFSYRFLL